MKPTELEACRTRHSASGSLWFTGPASFTAQAARDRRDLLQHIATIEACLLGVSSCSTCSACRGAAMLVLGEKA